jgi:hypothetical protein
MPFLKKPVVLKKSAAPEDEDGIEFSARNHHYSQHPTNKGGEWLDKLNYRVFGFTQAGKIRRWMFGSPDTPISIVRCFNSRFDW